MPELVGGGGWLGVYLPDNTLCGQLETLRAPLKGFQAANVSFFLRPHYTAFCRRKRHMRQNR